jgi:hypothetical protein
MYDVSTYGRCSFEVYIPILLIVRQHCMSRSCVQNPAEFCGERKCRTLYNLLLITSYNGDKLFDMRTDGTQSKIQANFRFGIKADEKQVVPHTMFSYRVLYCRRLLGNIQKLFGKIMDCTFNLKLTCLSDFI